MAQHDGATSPAEEVPGTDWSANDGHLAAVGEPLEPLEMVGLYAGPTVMRVVHGRERGPIVRCGVGRNSLSEQGKAVTATRANAMLKADRTGAVSSAKSRASEGVSVKAKPLVEERPAARSQPPAKAKPVAKVQPLATSKPVSKTRLSEPATDPSDDPFIAEARRKVDAMSAEVAAQEKKHRATLARVQRDREELERKIENLERRIEELTNVERRFETLKRHLDGSLTWRLGGGLRSALRAWRKLGRPAGKGA